MLKLANVQIKEGGHVWGDMAEKVAFDVAVEPANILGAVAGGYAATRIQQNAENKVNQANAAKKTLENDYYGQVNNLLSDLKIVFTPINVVYSVNGQVFEIIKTSEMNSYMRNAFLKKDGEFFKKLLLNKMNMEMQLAEQVFAQRLLMQNGNMKEATFLDNQVHLMKVASEDFEKMASDATKGLDGVTLTLPVNFDSLRPFSQSSLFFNDNEFSKVAGIFDYFSNSPYESVDLKELKAQVKVGFLPDRVVFLHNGQLLDQLSAMHMNEKGYEAFRKQDKEFFYKFFNKEATKISDQVKNQPELFPHETEEGEEQQAADEDDLIQKEADSLEEVVENLELASTVPDVINLFTDPDIHPMVYDKILTKKYGKNWKNYEVAALFKQIEVDYNLTDGLGDNPLDKLSMIYAVASEESSVFLTSFSFEKFLRAMNDKVILFEEFQGNLEFDEILFGIEMAKIFRDDDVFLEFHYTLAEYVSEELYKDGIRVVSDQVFDENNEDEKDFYDRVNTLLMRKWKETDAHSLEDETEITRSHRRTEAIADITEKMLAEHAERIDLANPFLSAQQIFEEEQFFQGERAVAVKRAVADGVVRHIGAAIFLEVRKEEAQATLVKLEEKGV